MKKKRIYTLNTLNNASLEEAAQHWASEIIDMKTKPNPVQNTTWNTNLRSNC